jgi:hypothetical protein
LTTSVVKVDRRNKNYDVYIGRAWAGLPASKWANPFRVRLNQPETREERQRVISAYEKYIRNKPDLMAAIPELVDQVLGCWCYPEECHGDVLVRLVKEFQSDNRIY